MPTCHWCHVMERESFEDEEVAALLNERYIAIKVDREERPDIDHIYMTVCQAMTGHGGWPLTIIMTPDKEPFYAGTYFPKESKWGRPGLMELLGQLADKWQSDQQELLELGNRAVEALKPHFGGESGDIAPSILDDAFQRFNQQFDTAFGGFDDAPKFPSPHNLLFLLRYWKSTGRPQALNMVQLTLNAMRDGGIYDHVGYGFARYSTDRKWLIPHFEKMLYDNALLAYVYTEAYQATGNRRYAQTAQKIITYVLRDMTSPEGGFYSAEDADSEGIEGKFYVWTPQQIKGVLGERDGERFCRLYGITEQGNFENGASVPHLIGQSPSAFAKEEGMSEEQFRDWLAQAREKLFNYREKRIHPHKDDKILTSWNGLMIAALAKAARVFQSQTYAQAAENAAAFILARLKDKNDRLLARFRDGEAAYPAYLDDYAFMIWGLMELYETSLDPEALHQAIHLNRKMMELFWDENEGGFFFYGSDSEQLFARPKETYDGAMPSGNSAALYNLVRLAKITGDPDLEKMAEKQIKAFAGNVKQALTGHAFFLAALLFAWGDTKEIVVAGLSQSQDTLAMVRWIQQQYLPDSVFLYHPEEYEDGIERLAPFIKGQRMAGGKATVYICKNYACQAPINDLEELKHHLK